MKKYIIGMDLGGTNIKTSLFTKDFSVVAEQRTPTMVSLGSEGVCSEWQIISGSCS